MFHYSEADLYCDDVPLADVAARVGTPAYVYSNHRAFTITERLGSSDADTRADRRYGRAGGFSLK